MDKNLERAIGLIADYAMEHGLSIREVADNCALLRQSYIDSVNRSNRYAEFYKELGDLFVNAISRRALPFEPEKGAGE